MCLASLVPDTSETGTRSDEDRYQIGLRLVPDRTEMGTREDQDRYQIELR